MWTRKPYEGGAISTKGRGVRHYTTRRKVGVGLETLPKVGKTHGPTLTRGSSVPPVPDRIGGFLAYGVPETWELIPPFLSVLTYIKTGV